jgi:hypothetical protein
MVDIDGVHCYRSLRCSGGTGIFQRHNFEGMWSLSPGEELSGGHPHYEHRTPNGQVVHLFQVHSAYGGAPRWVIGPVPGNENGWGFVDTPASHPEIIQEKWMVWMETSWEESRRLHFRGVADGDEDDEEEDEEDGLGGADEAGAGAEGARRKKKKGAKKGTAKAAGAKKGAKKGAGKAAAKGKVAREGSDGSTASQGRSPAKASKKK